MTDFAEASTLDDMAAQMKADAQATTATATSPKRQRGRPRKTEPAQAKPKRQRKTNGNGTATDPAVTAIMMSIAGHERAISKLQRALKALGA